MNPATAALIAAGVASVVSLGSQFLAHVLSVRRDRRNQWRDRLFNVVVAAGVALHGQSTDKPVREPGVPRPGTMAAIYPELQNPDLRALHERTFDALGLLQVHFGEGHWLVDEYVKASVACAQARATMVRHLDEEDDQVRMANIPELARVLRAGKVAADRWSTLARDAVKRM